MDHSHTDLSENVGRGAAVLDEKCPGWWDRIKINQLNMARGDKCILGQLYGRYYPTRLFCLNLSGEAEALHGFDIYWDSEDREYRELRRLWIAAIKSRRGQ